MLDLLRRLWDPVATPVAAIGVFLAQHLWSRYQSRRVVVRWSVSHLPFASGGEHSDFGRVEVRWNDAVVPRLQWCSVEVENESGSADLSDVPVNLWYTDGTHFLGRGTVFNTTQLLPYSERFDAVLQRIRAAAAETTAEDFDFAASRRELIIPVLNRGAKIGLAFMVRPGAADPPHLSVAIEKLGVKALERKQRPTLYGVVQTHAAWAGVAAGTIVTTLVASSTTRVWLAASVGLVLGAFAQITGVALIRLARAIIRALG